MCVFKIHHIDDDNGVDPDKGDLMITWTNKAPFELKRRSRSEDQHSCCTLIELKFVKW